ncbi:MAG TPA: HAD-IA family hydrolase [Armatimonadota bacterium]
MIQDCTAFVFDLDGTLVTSDLDFPAMKAAVVRLAVERGLPPEPLESLDILAAVDHACASLCCSEPFRAEAEEALAAFEIAGARRNRELGGSLETLHALRSRGCRIGIVTRNCRAAVAATLSRVPLPYDVLLTRSDVAHAKPHPEHLRRCLEALGADPGRSAMVGDHWMDVQAGRQAGMHTVGILGPHTSARFDQLPPDLVLSQPSDLLAYLPPCA